MRDRAFPVEDGEGEVYRNVGIARAITEQRQAREALRCAKEKFRAVFDIGPVRWPSRTRAPATTRS